MSTASRRIEAAVAALLTLAAIWLHFLAARSLGALWRDEAGSPFFYLPATELPVTMIGTRTRAPVGHIQTSSAMVPGRVGV